MEFLDFIFYISIIYLAYKAGLHIGRFRLWSEIAEINKRVINQIEETVTGQMTVEKINGQYYAYLNNTFIAQAATIEEMTKILEQFIIKNPIRYTSINVQVKN
jgi:hypothetical protein